MTEDHDPTSADDALVALLRDLRASGYVFITPNPATHALVRARGAASHKDILRDVFGWARRFTSDQLPRPIVERMREARILKAADDSGFVSALRVSTVDDHLYFHSAPTTDDDAVFLGPDSYRYARLLRTVLGAGRGFRRALDIGTGAGVGALTLLSVAPDAEVWGSDVNPSALRLAALNARHAGLSLRTLNASGVPEGPADLDLIVANPPYIAGDRGKTYRDGGEDLGTALGLGWVRSGVERLAPGGRLILYTGAPIVGSFDPLRRTLTALAHARGMELVYEEIDPDVFGGTLRQSAYRDVERIAAVGAVLTARP